jgi:FMN phosphatase YigB (HAD superfamily)
MTPNYPLPKLVPIPLHSDTLSSNIESVTHFLDRTGDVGWRKPHKRIFEDALERLQVEAGEAIYVGDSPLEDIKGAEAADIRTVFVPSQFNNLVDLHASGQKPNCIVADLKELYRNFSKIVTC